MKETRIFVVVQRDEERELVTGHAITTKDIDKEYLDNLFQDKNEDGKESSNQPSEAEVSPYPETFEDVEKAFAQAMLMYRKSVVQTIRVATLLANVQLSYDIDRIVGTSGTKLEDLSTENLEVYELPEHAASALHRHREDADALIEGAMHLPKISTIGIISSYDAILADLLRVIFSRKPEIIFTSDRDIKFSDLVNMGSIDEAKESIINNEIEAVIRQSHHEQFSWMERKFSMRLKEGLTVWPDFIELCERRNLLTHTGGIVSEQYIRNCTKYGRKPSCAVGERLLVDMEYLKQAIDIVTEVGYKLIHTMWRKFAPDEREQADSTLNAFGMNLISTKQYKLAENLLEFAVNQKTHHSDLLKRMMVVNLANAAKLTGSRERSDKALSAHDWTATSYQFQVCVAAVRNDFSEVVRILEMGRDVVDLAPSDFREWPVFIDARKDQNVREAFEKAYGEALVIPATENKTEKSRDKPQNDSSLPAPESSTVH